MLLGRKKEHLSDHKSLWKMKVPGLPY